MFIQVDEAKLFATAFGAPAAPALVAVGGWIGSWELWLPPFAALSREWYTIGFDHRGAGATMAPMESITFDRLVDDVFAVMDAYGVEEAVLAGESAGAAVVLGAALKQPARVRGLVIVSGRYFATPASPDQFALGLRHQYAATLDAFVDASVPEPDSVAIKHWGRQILDRAAPEAALALYELGNRVDLRGEVARITQPTLIIHGERDRLVPVVAARDLAYALPQAELVLLAGAGHVPTMTRADEIVAAISSFFGSGR